MSRLILARLVQLSVYIKKSSNIVRLPMSKIRVLRVIARMNVGGPAFLIKELMQGLDPLIFEQILVYGVCEGKEKEIGGIPDLGRTYQLPQLKRSVSPLRDLRALSEIARIIRLEKPDVIDTHTFKAGFLIRALFLFSWNRKIKLVHHYHGHLLNGYFSRQTLILYRFIEKTLARKADILITDGDSITRELIASRIAPPEKFLRITPGVATRIPDSPRQAMTSTPSTNSKFPVIAFIGRMAPIKRPDRYLKVVQELTHRNVDCTFLMYGEGELLSTIRDEIIRSELKVDLLPFEKDIYQILKRIDILVMTSDNEGTPLTIMECSFAGVPCVGTDVGSMRDIVKDGINGFLVTPDVNLLANKIEELIEDVPALKTLQETCVSYANEHFNVKDYVVAHQNLYASLLNSGKERLI